MSATLRNYLNSELERRKRKNARYSIRSFARDLAMDATALSRMLSGARPISAKAAQKLLSRLKIAPTIRETLLRSLVSPADHGVPSDSDYVELSSSQLERMDEWSYSAILELSRSSSLSLDEWKISRFLGLPLKKTEALTKTLVELGLLRRTERGLKKVHDRSTAPFRKGSAALKRIKEGYIARAIEAMSHDEAEHDISGITVLISRDKLPEASRRIKEFRRSLAQYLASDEGDDLYRINVQLFPLKKP